MKQALKYLILLIAGCSACASVSNTTYKDDGFTFHITKEFRIGTSETFERNKATYIPIEARDENIYAKFSVIWLPGYSDLDWEINNYVSSLDSLHGAGNIGKPQYTEIKSIRFGSNAARYIGYRIATDGPRTGSYTTFHCENLTVIIGEHYTPESEAMLNKCRQLIESTYSCLKKAK